MPQNVSGTFAASASTTNAGMRSDTLVIPSGVTSFRLSLSGDIDTNNRVNLSKSLDGWQTITAIANYLTVQSNTAIPAANGEQFRLTCTTAQAGKVIYYSLSAES